MNRSRSGINGVLQFLYRQGHAPVTDVSEPLERDRDFQGLAVIVAAPQKGFSGAESLQWSLDGSEGKIGGVGLLGKTVKTSGSDALLARISTRREVEQESFS